MFTYCISRRVYPRLKLLNRVPKYLSWKSANDLNNCRLWLHSLGGCGKQNALHLEHLQNQAMHVILRASRKTCTQFMRSKLTLLSLCSRRQFMRLQIVYKIINNIDSPHQLKGYLVKRSELHDRNFRDSSPIDIMRAKSAMGQCGFKSAAAHEWNSLPRNIRDTSTLGTVKSKLFNYFPNLDVNLHVCNVRLSYYLVS